MQRITEESSTTIDMVFETAPYGVYLDEPSRGCTYANPALLKLFGVSWEEFAGFGWARHVVAEDAERVQALIQEYEHTHEPIDVVYRVMVGDETRYVRARVSAILDDQGKHAGSMGLIYDVTEQQVFERNVVQSQKLAAIGQLSARLAHDLNNLLTAIIGSAELMALKIDDQDAARHMATLELAFDQARQLTGPLLTLTRQRVMARAVIPIDAEVQKLQRLLAGTLGEGIQINMQLAADDCHVPLDQTQMGQILLNLATNGSDSMGGRGVLGISTRQEGEHVILDVVDEGEGLAEQTRLRAFEAFFTTKDEGRGSGLGLATVRHLVEFAGGSIDLIPGQQKGTIARVRLPVVEPDLYGDEVTGQPTAENLNARGEVVLLVEDQEAVRQSLGYSLALANFDVRAAGSLAEARMRLEEARHIDLLITDVMLPDGVGTTLAELVRKRYPQVQTIYTSGFAGQVAANIDTDDPNIVFVAKPFRTREIMQAVRLLRSRTERLD